MKHRPIRVIVATIVALMACAGCSSLAGAHRPELAVVPPTTFIGPVLLIDRSGAATVVFAEAVAVSGTPRVCEKKLSVAVLLTAVPG